ncbi:MAG: hypothetical protein EWV60_12305, partial [Microcystis sp. Msp_OC_L_20101000_S702]|uniref:hypothetical protein n=1 Tax=Microcystis sp. Msp_OC_L_20101000_S702 TaxID=2486218 RepID=UPI001197B2A7
PICALSPFLYEFQLLLSVVALIEFYFKLIICITIPEEPKIYGFTDRLLPECFARTFSADPI